MIMKEPWLKSCREGYKPSTGEIQERISASLSFTDVLDEIYIEPSLSVLSVYYFA